MNPIYGLAAIAIGFLILRLFATTFFRKVGKTALAKQSDEIHLQRVENHAWRNADTIAALEAPLAVKGFTVTGTYKIPEMPPLAIRLFAKTAEASYACIYEHEKAGTWVETFSRYQDGTGITYTIMPARGLKPRPGHPVVHFPGLGSGELYARFIRERPGGALEHIRSEDLARYFERSYAESMAWRKQEGISAQEVARVAASRKPSAQ
jgi:hypothetical protein